MSDLKKLLILLIVVVFIAHPSDAQYQLHINYIGKDTSFNLPALKLQTNFTNRTLCMDYINTLPAQLNVKGYLSASVDSVHYDTSFASIQLYPGIQQHWAQLRLDSVDKIALDASGFTNKDFKDKPVNMLQLQSLEQHLLNYYEKNGYPFAAVFLDSIGIIGDGMSAMLKLRKGPLYHIDSIHVQGDVVIDNHFLQEYLGIVNGSPYNLEKLQQVDKRLATLSYLRESQPSNLTML
ncbi:MAG TPA: hypothetical protein VK796_02340, partial [Cytophaga sp.]|nr:hypothetical protein [Cytophaga sp.]